MIVLLMTTVLFALAGCAMPVAEQWGEAWHIETPKTSSRLYRMEVEHNGTLRFEGLVVVRVASETFDYVLLDSSGVTLLAVQVHGQGTDITTVGKGVLKDSALVDLLTTSFSRIFLLRPDSLPCGRRGLMKLCAKKTEQDEFTKESHFGPFLYWRATSFPLTGIKGNGGAVDKEKRQPDTSGFTYSYHYFQPWLGLRIRMTEQKN